MNWQNYPLIRLVIPFILGMVVACVHDAQMNTVVLLALCCILLALLFLFLRKSQSKYLFGGAAMLLSFFVGMTLYTNKYQSIAHGVPQDSASCKGVLAELSEEKAKSWALNLEQNDGTHIILYIGKSRNDYTSDSIRFSRLGIGDTIFANTTHLNATNGGDDGTFAQYHKHLFAHGICATCYAPCDQWQSHSLQSTANLSLSAKLIQQKLHSTYNERGINGDSGDIIEAMTIGMKENLDKETRQTYATAGTSHVLAMSGLHVGLIAIVLQVFFIAHVVPHHRVWICNVFIIILLWCFAIIAGMSPSIIRATLMFSILLLCQSFTHELMPLNSCALAAAIMLCINPLYINDAGFQLSFVSVASIGLLGGASNTSYPPLPAFLRLLKGIIIISLICTIATAPLVAYHFGRVPLLSVASNIVIAPLVYVIMWGSLLWWMFLWLVPFNTLLTNVLNWAADTMNSVTERIATMPHSTIEWHPSATATTLCYIQLLIIAYILRTIKIKNRI